ncbi:hypothetical protein CC2G_013034 [Coprinopsis cinerea AmutBmut pab1-1]|nr:hypothetical protein CC2G_013034 [Coprinopsis cinerea AmutBmut pab1-1]
MGTIDQDPPPHAQFAWAFASPPGVLTKTHDQSLRFKTTQNMGIDAAAAYFLLVLYVLQMGISLHLAAVVPERDSVSIFRLDALDQWSAPSSLISQPLGSQGPMFN